VNRHALTVLEFPRVLDEVAERAVSGPGAAKVRALAPVTDQTRVEREHARVVAVRALRSADAPIRATAVPDLAAALDRLRVPGLSWTPEALRDCTRLLASSRLSRDALTSDDAPAARAVLADLRDRLFCETAIEARLQKSITDDDASVADGASPTLKRIRRDLRSAEGEVVKVLERLLTRLDASARVPDMSVTMRNGRYVIPVRRDARVEIGGIVHDASATGATVFVEPPAAIEHSNRLRELEAAEREEIERVLLELTDLLRPHRDALIATLDALAELDSLHARAAFADAFHCEAPAFGAASSGFSIARGRHPLLLAGGVDAVPFDLAIDASERTVVISGPNTGGKTVLLKAVGLLSLMAQSGIPPTAAAGSRFAMFDDIFADIGDEQSIEASLSTFSAHLRNLAEILASSTADSLVLVDELGSGTDPLEGAALGWAILESLTLRRATTLATSHLGTLKELATRSPAVVNASLQFDEARLAPTYRFVKGVPGRSYGISIARRLALPGDVVARAEERLPRAERDLAALLEQLEAQHRALTDREAELAAMTEDARAKAQRIGARERTVREKERELERQSRQEARKYLLNARAEIERTVKELKRASGDVDEKARAARHQAELLAGKQAEALRQLDEEERQARTAPRGRALEARALKAGDHVRVDSLGGKTGRVLDVRDDGIQVAVGVLKITVPGGALVRLEPDAVAPAPLRGDVPEPEPRGEVDLRGLRVDEMETQLYRALDDAIRAALPTLRIIHGKGTGALRERVNEMLTKDTRVRQFRLGAWNEGGSGVTVAELG